MIRRGRWRASAGCGAAPRASFEAQSSAIATAAVFAVAFALALGAGCRSVSPDAGSDPAGARPVSSHIGATPSAQAERLLSRLEQRRDHVMVVAHRGCWREAPENSLAAIESCIRMGVDMVELDVRMSADGHLVLMHDEAVDRTTNGAGRVDAMTLRELRKLRLRAGQGGDDAPITEERIPTVAEALTAARDKVIVNLDVKGELIDDAWTLTKALGMQQQVLFKMTVRSPDDLALGGAAFVHEGLFMPLVREQFGPLGEQVARLAVLDPVAFEIIYQIEAQLPEACREAAAQKARCWVNTMWDSLSPGHSDDVSVSDPDAHWGYLIGLGVDTFQTDRPAELIQYLSRKGLRHP